MAKSKNFEEFAKRMEIIAKGIESGAEKSIRRAVIAADVAAVVTTPFDTGRAKGNWLAAIGRPKIKEKLFMI